ncbi:MAG: DUF3460 family protein [Zoogloea sp.]|nr:DUF3460 family protein [Zoogloea sp.]
MLRPIERLARFLHLRPQSAGGGVARDYVSEFAGFMDGYLKVHPEVIRDQRTGWRIYWDKKVDFDELADEREDSVPTESYYYFGNPSGPTASGRKKGE